MIREPLISAAGVDMSTFTNTRAWLGSPLASHLPNRLDGFPMPIFRMIAGAFVILTWMVISAPVVAQEISDTTPSCAVPPEQLHRLSPRAQCYITTFQRRCNASSACMVRCISKGAGQSIGGGCWHICFAYTGLPWEEPRSLRQCPTSTPAPQPPAPTVSCQDSAPRSTLEIYVVADSGGAPVSGAAVALLTPLNPIVRKLDFETDSAGQALIGTVPPGHYDAYVRAIGYQNSDVFGVTLAEESRCRVVVRLARFWDGGF